MRSPKPQTSNPKPGRWLSRKRLVRVSDFGLRISVFFLFGALLAGCGYSHKELFPPQYQTVAVDIFDNHTFYRGVERDLTEALVKEIELRTPYKVAPASAAGTAIHGRIARVDQQMISRRRRGGLPQEMEVSITVDFTWKDQRTGETIRARRGFESVGRYLPASPIGQPFEIARHQAVQRLASDIVSTMQAPW